MQYKASVAIVRVAWLFSELLRFAIAITTYQVIKYAYVMRFLPLDAGVAPQCIGYNGSITRAVM